MTEVIDVDGGRELRIGVHDGTVSLELRPLGARRVLGSAVTVPAGRLLCALGSAWDEARRWQVASRWPDEDGWYDGDDGPDPDDLDDLCRREPDPDDPEWGDRWRDARSPWDPPPPPPPAPPRPARAGETWTEEDETRLRDLWLAASPQADRDTVVEEIAVALERSTCGVRGRLRKVGCHYSFPGITTEGALAVAARIAAERSVGADERQSGPVRSGHGVGGSV